MEQSDILERLMDGLPIIENTRVPDFNAMFRLQREAAAEITRLRAALDERLVASVKPLSWHPYPNEHFAGPNVAVADAIFSHRYQVQRDPWALTYMAFLHPTLPITSSTLWWESKGHKDLEAAKAAAQADYTARILSAITTTTAASVRAEALREGYDLGFANSGEGYNGEYGADATGDYYIQRRAEAIIALIDPPEKSE